jgi:hypothetical protein
VLHRKGKPHKRRLVFASSFNHKVAYRSWQAQAAA